MYDTRIINIPAFYCLVIGIIKPSNVRADKSPLETTPKEVEVLARSSCYLHFPGVTDRCYSRGYGVRKVTEKEWGCLCQPLPASLPLSISELQILQPLWLWSLPQQENSSSAPCGLMLTADEKNSKFPVGAIYQESELTYHNRVPQVRSWTFGSPTSLPSPPTPSPPGVKKQPWISVRPAANH